MSTSVAELDIQPPKQSALGAGFSRLDNAQKVRLGLGHRRPAGHRHRVLS
ncbi:MAG: hypothetical protein R3E42_06785 [Burkholderiaceae bacterium]